MPRLMPQGKKRCIQGAEVIMSIIIKHKGSFKNTKRLFNRLSKFEISSVLNKYGELGVNALSSATPVDSGSTADSWGYDIEINKGSYTIVWTNSNVNQGVNIALILQLGHGTGTGGYVQGRDYINPAIQPIFDALAEEAWQEVTNG